MKSAQPHPHENPCATARNFSKLQPGAVLCAVLLIGQINVLAEPGDQLWVFPTADPILSSPAIGADGTIYVGSYDRNFYALTPAGAQKWAFALPTSGYLGIYSSPALGADGTVYFGAEDGILYALNPADGSSKWTFGVGNAVYSDPAVGPDGTIYIGSYDLQGNSTAGKLYAINPNGSERWQYSPADAIFSDPVVATDGTVYFGCDDGGLYALNSNGSLRWKFDTGPKAITASPTLGPDGKVYIGVGSMFNPRFYCVNPDGTTNWIFNATNRIRSSAALGADGTVYFGSDDNHLYALNGDGTLKWSTLLSGFVGSSPALAADGNIYVGCDDGNLYALDGSGAILWSSVTYDLVFSSPAIGADGTVYVGSQDYGLYALSGTAGLAHTAWPMFRRDVRHTGKMNALPVISVVPDQLIDPSASLGPLAFTVSDEETPAGELIVTAESSNGAVVPNSQIQLTGTGGDRFLTATPVADLVGATVITLFSVDTAGATNSTSFRLRVGHPPEAFNEAFAANEDTTLSVSAPGLLANDIDPGGAGLTAQIVMAASHGTVTLNADGGFSYLPVSNYNGGDSFTYQVSDGAATSAPATVTLTVAPVNDAPVLFVPATPTINELVTLNVNATATDVDLPANKVTFALVSGPAGLTVSTNGAISWKPTEAQGPGTYDVTMRVFDNGVPSLSDTQTFQVVVGEVNVAPVLTLPSTQTIIELTTLNATVRATDADLPTNTLTFALVSGPANLTVAESGAISWTPTETQGGLTHTVKVQVSDGGVPSLSTTGSFQVIVKKTNSAPVLTIPTWTINELTNSTFKATAIDSDIPTNTLKFAKVTGPKLLTVSSTGTVAWNPTEAQGPGISNVTVKVTDNGSPAKTTTTTFQVIVQEVNVAPLLTVPATQTINELAALSVKATATDADLPANKLTFELVSGPAGLNVATNGTVSWVPAEDQGPSTNTIALRVFDNGTPSLSRTGSFLVIVKEVNVRPVITVPATQTIDPLTTLDVTATATDADLPANRLTFGKVSGPTGLTVSTNGVITWTPTSSQAGTTNTVKVRVFDNGTTSLSATGSFQVIVRKVTVAARPVPTTQALSQLTAPSTLANASDVEITADNLTLARAAAGRGPDTKAGPVRATDQSASGRNHREQFQAVRRETNRHLPSRDQTRSPLNG